LNKPGNDLDDPLPAASQRLRISNHFIMDDISKSLQNMHRYSFNTRAHATEEKTGEDSTGFTLPSQMNQISLDDPAESPLAVESPLDIAGRPRTGYIDAKEKEKRKRSYVVISGGTAANDFVHAFGENCAFVLPGESVCSLLCCSVNPYSDTILLR
jgi:hypothetical protein